MSLILNTSIAVINIQIYNEILLYYLIYLCSISCAYYCLCLWIVHYWLTLRFSLMFVYIIQNCHNLTRYRFFLKSDKVLLIISFIKLEFVLLMCLFVCVVFSFIVVVSSFGFVLRFIPMMADVSELIILDCPFEFL